VYKRQAQGYAGLSGAPTQGYSGQPGAQAPTQGYSGQPGVQVQGYAGQSQGQGLNQGYTQTPNQGKTQVQAPEKRTEDTAQSAQLKQLAEMLQKQRN
jgi:hypothetical protein